MEVFCKAGIRKILKLTPVSESSFDVSGLRSATLPKKRLQRRYLSVNFAKFLKTPFSYKTAPVTVSEQQPASGEI